MGSRSGANAKTAGASWVGCASRDDVPGIEVRVFLVHCESVIIYTGEPNGVGRAYIETRAL